MFVLGSWWFMDVIATLIHKQGNDTRTFNETKVEKMEACCFSSYRDQRPVSIHELYVIIQVADCKVRRQATAVDNCSWFEGGRRQPSTGVVALVFSRLPPRAVRIRTAGVFDTQALFFNRAIRTVVADGNLPSVYISPYLQVMFSYFELEIEKQKLIIRYEINYVIRLFGHNCTYIVTTAKSRLVSFKRQCVMTGFMVETCLGSFSWIRREVNSCSKDWIF